VRIKQFISISVAIFLSVLFFSGEVQTLAAAEAQPAPYLVANPLPSDQQALRDWCGDLIRETDATGSDSQLFPVVREFRALIENDPELYQLFTQMFEQVPRPTSTTPPANRRCAITSTCSN
jgi:Phophatidylserine decarboxylase.